MIDDAALFNIGWIERMAIRKVFLHQVYGDCVRFCQHIIIIHEHWHRMLWINFQKIIAVLLFLQQIDCFHLVLIDNVVDGVLCDVRKFIMGKWLYLNIQAQIASC